MSKYKASHDEDIPRFEPWLGVLFASLVPVIVALFVPRVFAVPLIVMTVFVFVAGLVMLRLQSRRRGRDQASVPEPMRSPDRITADAS